MKLILLSLGGKKSFMSYSMLVYFFQSCFDIILSSTTLMGKLWLRMSSFFHLWITLLTFSFCVMWRVCWEIKRLRVCRRLFRDKHFCLLFVLCEFARKAWGITLAFSFILFASCGEFAKRDWEIKQWHFLSYK